MNLSRPRRPVSGMPLLLAALLAGIAFGGWRDAAAANQSVSIDGFAFLPGTVSVAVGETVTWRNDQPNTPHTVSSDTAGAFDSGSLSTGNTFAQTFSAAGSFAYHCNIHPGMSGLVIVTGAAATTPVPTAAAATATGVPPTATTAPPTSTAVPATTTTSAASPSVSASPTPLATTGALAPATGTKDDGDGGTSAGIWIVAAIAALAVAGAAGFVLMRRRGTSPGP